jgi:hypothetical protein
MWTRVSLYSANSLPPQLQKFYQLVINYTYILLAFINQITAQTEKKCCHILPVCLQTS